jgi:hypothetical protein
MLFSSISISPIYVCLYLQSVEAHPTSNSSGNGGFDAMDLLNKAINAIGGLDTVNRITSITYQASKLENPTSPGEIFFC